MRWERLFADLEARLEAEERVLAEADVSDLIRAERAQLALRDRLRAHVGQVLTWSLGVRDPSLEGRLVDVGADWVLIAVNRGERLLPISALQFVAGMTGAALPDTREVARRFGLAIVLRGLARDRAVVSVQLTGGLSVAGTIDRVGADHIDLAVHAHDVPRRPDSVIDVRCVLIPAIVSIVVQ